jgi:hypothetical protein
MGGRFGVRAREVRVGVVAALRRVLGRDGAGRRFVLDAMSQR